MNIRSRPDPLKDSTRFVWILLAAGSSTRFGGDRSKLLEPLGDGRVIDVTFRSLKAALPGAPIILVSSPELRDDIGEKCAWTEGGARRQDSARKGLAAAGGAVIALIHDAARPFVTRAIVDRLRAALLDHDAAAPGVAVTDTIRALRDGRAETLDRASLRAMQTPQAVWLDAALAAFERTAGAEEFTDDLAVVAASDGRIAVTEGDRRNIKITTRGDLEIAAKILESLSSEA